MHFFFKVTSNWYFFSWMAIKLVSREFYFETQTHSYFYMFTIKKMGSWLLSCQNCNHCQPVAATATSFKIWKIYLIFHKITTLWVLHMLMKYYRVWIKFIVNEWKWIRQKHCRKTFTSKNNGNVFCGDRYVRSI